jgi:hypothetical protein
LDELLSNDSGYEHSDAILDNADAEALSRTQQPVMPKPKAERLTPEAET